MQEILEIFRHLLRFLFFLVILWLFLLFLFYFFLVPIFIFSFDQLLLITIGCLVVLSSIILFRRSRYRLWKYFLRILIWGITLGIGSYISFFTIPEFNFFLTFNARQQIVKNINADNLLIFGKSWLGEISYYPNSVYFTHVKGANRMGPRMFFVYTTKPNFDHRMSVKKLRENWYFIQGSYAD